MSQRTRPTRWPDGPVISVVVAEDAIALCHCQTADGEAVTESIGALAGRPDMASLATRLKDLRPRTAIVALAIPPTQEDFDAGVSFGAVIGLLAAFGIQVEWASPPVRAMERGCALH